MSVPNQKIVEIAPRTVRSRDNLYAMLNLDALRTAMQELNGSSLKLWLYFDKNQDNYHLELSQKACLQWGIRKDSYYSAVRDLQDRGYLLPIAEGSNIFRFYEKAQPFDSQENSEYSISDLPEKAAEKSKTLSNYQMSLSKKTGRNNINNTKIEQYKTKQPGRPNYMDWSEEAHHYRMLASGIEELLPEYITPEEKQAVHNLLRDCKYINDPETRLAQMTPHEHAQMQQYYQMYIKDLALKSPWATKGWF